VESSLVRFVALLRHREVRVSTGEAIDAARGLASLGMADRAVVKTVLGATLVKDRRDWSTFSDLFDSFFRLEDVPGAPRGDGHEDGHEDLPDSGPVDRATMSEEPSDRPQEGHSHAKPVDVKEFFEDSDMATRYSLHQEANKVDLASGTEELVLSKDQGGATGAAARRVQLETARLHGALRAKSLAAAAGTKVDVDLTVAEEQALADWLGAEAEGSASVDDDGALDALLADLPARLKAHLERLSAQGRHFEGGDVRPAWVENVSGSEQDQMEEALRRLGRTLRGAMTHRKRPTPHGRIDVARTMRRNLRFEGIPFVPVTVGRQKDRPRLVVLADVSLSVRNAARFTLHMVHGLQRLYPEVRTFVFVDQLAEVTELFEEHHVGDALGLVFGGKILDVDTNSDYGRVFETFVNDHMGALTRRTSVLVLGDARGNGNDPGVEAFETIARRARRVVWLTPEPRYSWRLGRCDIGSYAEFCERVEVVRDVSALTRVALAGEVFGRVLGAR
jgi:uncharacterized protein